MGKPQNDTQKNEVSKFDAMYEECQEMSKAIGKMADEVGDVSSPELKEKLIKMKEVLASFTSEDLELIDKLGMELGGEVLYEGLVSPLGDLFEEDQEQE